MVRKNKQMAMTRNDCYILPSINAEIREFVNKFKIDMMNHIVTSIKFAIENNISIIEVFQFKNSPFVITINRSEFEANLSHINKFYMEHELYEMCSCIKQLIETITDNRNHY